jgi:tetratricopeptide (TPR) repeat protein
MTLEHDFILSHSFISPPATLFSLLTLMGITIAALFLAKRERIFSFCLLWFLGNLLIESSFIPLEIIFEHRTYLPSMLLITLIILAVQRVFTNELHKALLLVVVIILLSNWTYARNSIWKNKISLGADIAAKAPNKPRAQMNFGILLSGEGRFDEAMVYLNRAVQLDPDYDIGYYSLGDALLKQKKYIQASESYAKALQIKPENALARFNLISHQVYYFMGNSLYQLGRYPEAIDAYRKASQEKPGYKEALQALSNTRKIIKVLQEKQPVTRP